MLKASTGKSLAGMIEKYRTEGWDLSGSPFFGVEGEGAFFHLMMKVKSVKG